jgi:hypothetical protein
MMRSLPWLTAAVLVLAVAGCTTGSGDGSTGRGDPASPSPKIDDREACSLYVNTKIRASDIVDEARSGGDISEGAAVRAFSRAHDYEEAAAMASGDIAAGMRDTVAAFKPLSVGEKFDAAAYDAAVVKTLRACAPLLTSASPS